MYFQACSNSAYPMHSCERYRTSGPLVVKQYDHNYMDRVKRIWYLSPMRAAKVQASLRIRAISPEPPLLAHTSIESRGTFRQKTRSLALLNCWACAFKICHDGMLEDTNSLDGTHICTLLMNVTSSVLHLEFSTVKKIVIRYE